MVFRIVILIIAIAAAIKSLWGGFSNFGQLFAFLTSTISCFAIAGWVTQRPILSQLAWRIYFGIYLLLFTAAVVILSAMWLMVRSQDNSIDESFGQIMFGALLQVPVLVGLYLYSFRSEHIWAKA
jgi:hypothetical protein